jgi:hypothetical protein
MTPSKKICNILSRLTKYWSNAKLTYSVWDDNNFDGELGSVTSWYGSEEHGDVLEVYLKKGNKKYGLNDIEYHINKHGYRIGKNINRNRTENIIACFGCSNTFGQGLPWNEIWCSVLNKKLGDNWITKNYGMCGASNDQIARLINNYLSYNKPKIICCYLPDIFRLELYDVNGVLVNFTPHCTNLDVFDYKAYNRISNESYCIYNFIKNFKFIYSMCKMHNVTLYWNTWSEPVLDMGKKDITRYLDFNSFTESLFDDSDEYLAIPHKFDWKSNAARDGSHFGSFIHEKLADSFYKKIIKDFK